MTTYKIKVSPMMHELGKRKVKQKEVAEVLECNPLTIWRRCDAKPQNATREFSLEDTAKIHRAFLADIDPYTLYDKPTAAYVKAVLEQDAQ